MKSMSLKHYSFLFTAVLLFGCGDKNAESQKEQNKPTTETTEKVLKNVTNASNDQSNTTQQTFKPSQKIIAMSNTERRQFDAMHFRVNDSGTNYFDKDGKRINLKIPVASEKLDIVDVINISNKKLNGILVVIDGNKGNPTLGKPISHFLQTTFKTEKVNGLKPATLVNKKLAVYILHDNEFYSDGLVNVVKSCFNKLNNYSEAEGKPLKCILPSNGIAPREIGGDIIPPVGG